MTIPSPSDDLVSTPLLDDRKTGASVLEAFWEAQNQVVPRGAVARAIGRSPLSADSRPLYAAALAESQVSERLRALAIGGDAWRVLHSVPVDTSGRDVDHVVIGRAGVFTLGVGSHGDEAVKRAHDEARRVSALLEAALGAPVPVAPLLVLVGGAGDAASPDASTLIVPAARIGSHLSRQPAVYSVDEVRALTRAALKPRTWPARAPRTTNDSAGSAPRPSQHDLQLWFGRVRSEVDATRRARVVCFAAAAVILLALVLSPEIIQGLSS